MAGPAGGLCVNMDMEFKFVGVLVLSASYNLDDAQQFSKKTQASLVRYTRLRVDAFFVLNRKDAYRNYLED